MMRRAWLMGVALLTVSVAWAGGAAAGSEAGRGRPTGHVRHRLGRHRHTGVYGRAAFAGRGHTIFAYLAIAVYDSVMAVEGGYEPFAVDVDTPAGASAQAAVAAAAHRVLGHYLRRRPPSSIPRTPRRWPLSLTVKRS